jgi:hypothetical protein
VNIGNRAFRSFKANTRAKVKFRISDCVYRALNIYLILDLVMWLNFSKREDQPPSSSCT